ncbi:MAG TPA: helix-turn-helix domain-containing protein [Actinomycetota bacterium]|nr:helix-turn-helix domain-containing protein [Actinomycetota bacterium]
MATAKRDLSNLKVQGSHVIDLREDVVTVDEVARRLDVPKKTLYRWRYQGVGPRSHRVGKHLRYRWSDVLTWIDGLE